MEIKKITLKNFRNHKEGEFTFTSGLNVIEGLNTLGKTNIVESVYFCAVGKSPRTSNDREAISWGENTAEIHLKAAKKYRDTQIDMILSKNGEKRIGVDGAGLSRIGELIGNLNIVYFSPEEKKMITDGPSERRKFLDISLSQQSKSYFYALSKYTKNLKNRNSLLKEDKSLKYIESTLPIWDAGLVEAGSEVIIKRLEFLEYLRPIVEKYHYSLTDSKERLDLEYETNIDIFDIRSDFQKKLVENREKDVKLKTTTVGPHRDDIIIKSNGIDIRTYGSQGQQKTAAISIKLAEAQCIEERTGDAPVLILDDVLSEIDEKRQRALLEYTKDLQVILTCPKFIQDERFIRNKIVLE